MKDHVQRFERFENDMLARWDKHLSWAETEKTALSTRMNIIESVWKSVERPIKAVGWMVTVFFAVIITTLATHLMDWFKHHWGK